MKKNSYTKTGFEDIIDEFMGFDLENYSDDKLKKKNLELESEVIRLRSENKKLKKKLSYFEKEDKKIFVPNKIEFDHTVDKITGKYPELSDESLKTLGTAEHLFKSEKSNLDYSFIYSSYVKVLEVEMKKYLNVSRKITLGNLIIELSKESQFKTFLEMLNKLKITEIRNRGTHFGVVNKYECGNLRKHLLGEGWLRRFLFLTNNIEEETLEEVEVDTLVLGLEEKIKVDNLFYNSYYTDSEEYILSTKPLSIGRLIGYGKKSEVGGLEYIILS